MTRDRYWQCRDDCTTDCGACKGAGRPATIRDTPHPYYGAEADRDYTTECETLDDLIAWANAYDEDMNFVYRWDWYVPTEQDIRLAAEDDEEISGETLTLFVVLQRKSRFLNVTAPVTAADEDKVREFLTSGRILGALRRTWAPLLDGVDELDELRAVRQRLDEKRDSLGMDAHVHGRELRMLDSIAGDVP